MGVILNDRTALEPLQWLALAIVSRNSGDHRDAIKAGANQPVDFLLRIKGKIDVSEDGTTTSTKTVGPNAELILARMCERMTAEQWAAFEEETRKDAADHSGTIPEAADSAVAKVKKLIGSMTTVTKETKSKYGPSKGLFEVGTVEMDSLTQAVGEAVVKATRHIEL